MEEELCLPIKTRVMKIWLKEIDFAFLMNNENA
jgi:hypothetical protein